jgi:type IV fimbrial biogenesis protein FimT
MRACGCDRPASWRVAWSAAGFTLIESCTALAALALLLSLGIPEFGASIRSAQLTSASNRLLFNLYLARSEAIKRNARVVLCKSGDGQSCAAAGGWEQGLVIFEDANNNAMLDPGEPLLHREAPFQDLRMAGNTPLRDYVSYGPMGQTRLQSGALQAGAITICRRSDGPDIDARQLVVNAAGRPRVERTVVSACI